MAFSAEFTLKNGTLVTKAPSDNCTVNINSVIYNQNNLSLRLIYAHYSADGLLKEVEVFGLDNKETSLQKQAYIGDKNEIIKVMLWQNGQSIKPVSKGAYLNFSG